MEVSMESVKLLLRTHGLKIGNVRGYSEVIKSMGKVLADFAIVQLR